MHLSLHFLGPFEAQLNNESKIESRAKKIEALLAFLATEAGRAHRRERLVGLLFPEMPDEQARTNLRQTLTRLRRLIQDKEADPPFLLVTRESTEFNLLSDHFIDAAQFETLASGCKVHVPDCEPRCEQCVEQLAKAVALYGGPFLDGFVLEDSAAFEEWLLAQRERYQEMALNAMEQLADYYERQGDYTLAADYVRRRLAIEPWQESAHRQLMRLLAYQGKRAAALQQYQALEELLHSELGVEPVLETRRLRDQIRMASDDRPVQLPPRNPAFVGREDELAILKSYLMDPDRRLMTVTGPGGSGKTAITIEMGWRLADFLLGPFIHGIYFVPLAGITTAGQTSKRTTADFDPVVTAIAEAIGFSFSGPRSPYQQVQRYLQDKSLLLIVDNVEHVIADGRSLFRDLLTHAPGLNILNTSRERLGLYDEWVIEVEGLPYPQATSSGEFAGLDLQDVKDLAGEYQAIALFERLGKKLLPSLELTPVEAAGQRANCPTTAVRRIVQLVQGLPLGIELAASWVRTLSCSEIADEIEKNLDFLQSTMQDVPSRHQNLRAVFDSSWQLLDESEQQALRRLSIFHGSFDRGAALSISGAPIPVMRSLVDHSLLQHQPTQASEPGEGAYQFLDVLRQFAGEQLEKQALEAQQVRQNHARYFLKFLSRQRDRLIGPDQRTAVADISHNIKEIRSAWQWSVEHQDYDGLAQALDALGLFYYMRSWFTEGAQLFALATAEVGPARVDDPQIDILWARLRARQGWFTFLLGNQQEGREQLLESIEALRGTGDAPDLAFSLSFSAAALSMLGEYRKAKTLAVESLRINDAGDDAYGSAIANNILSQIAFQQGDYGAAKVYSEASLALEKAIGNEWSIGFSLSNLGRVAFALQDYAEADDYFRESLAIRQSLKDARGEALCLRYLGDTALAQADFDQATQDFQTSLALFRTIGSQDETAGTMNSLGRLALQRRDVSAARTYFLEALQVARQAASTPRVLEALTGLARLLAGTNPAKAAQIAQVVQYHPASNRVGRQQADALLADLREAQTLSLPDGQPDVANRAELFELSDDIVDLFADLTHAGAGDDRQPHRPSTWHNLVPAFIVDQCRADELTGSFTAAGLFVDISGFTPLTETLMEHGQRGAEVLAIVMRAVFTPLVRSVFEQGGLVTGFAGDAFTAVFPTLDELPAPELRALAAAGQMQQVITENARQETRFGSFDFSAKIGLAAGSTNWGIIPAEESERATYYFSGAAIEECAQAEHRASAGEIVCADHFYQVVRDHITVEPRDGFWRINQISADLPPAQPLPTGQPDHDIMARFVPRFLIGQDIEGEFRQIFNLFVGLPGEPARSDVVAFMQHVFRLQDRYGGFLNRIDFGDKGCHLLLFWGAPLSHEQDLAHVLDFILELQRVGGMPLRAGITYRIAHAGYIGSSLAEEYTCYGRGVNLAARQMTQAAPGEIWLDGATAERAGADYELEALGDKSFKGIAEPEPVYRLIGQREKRVSRFDDGKKLVGRQHQLATLQQAVQPIFSGQFAGSLAVIGEAGIGKSRLIDALCRPLVEKEQVSVFLCQADELVRQSLNPFRYFLINYFNQSGTDSSEINKQRFMARLDELRAATAQQELSDELERTHSFLGHLIGLNWPDSLYEQLDPELRYENTLEGLKALIKAESLRRPVIMLLEDAHWWDHDSLSFLTRLARNVEGFPFALVISSREALAATLFEPSVDLLKIHLKRLEQTAVSDLAEDMLGHPPSAALLNLLVERTEGNPFFVEQMLLYLQGRGLLETIEAEDGRLPLDELYIPTDVRAILTARLDRLPLPVKDLVQRAAILGQEFETSILGAMTNDPTALDAYLAAAEAEDVWLSFGRSSYIFRHALLRDAAYDMQVGARLQQLHNRAAQAYEQQYPGPARAPRYATIAYHFDRAEETDKARDYYSDAASYAKGEFKNEDAIAYFSRALALTDDADSDSRYTLLCERETVLQWLGDRQRQLADLEELEALLAEHPQADREATVALRRSTFALVTGDYEKAEAYIEAALLQARSIQEGLLEAKAYQRRGRTLWQQGRGKEAREVLEKALDYAESADNDELFATCLVDLASVLRMEGNYQEARRYLQQAKATNEKLGDEQGIIRCLTLFGVVDYDLGFFTESEANYLRALDLARETGWRFAESTILVNIGNTLFDLGDFTNSSDYLEQSLRLTFETGDMRARATCLDTLGLIAHYSGNSSGAMESYSQAMDILRTIENQRELGYVLTHAGYAALELKQWELAASSLQEALERREKTDARALRIDTLAGLARLGLNTGQMSRALELTEEILNYLEQNGSEGIEFPVLVYLICAQVLLEASKEEELLRARALGVLSTGDALLEQRLQRLSDEQMRQRILANLPFNNELRTLHLALA